MPADNETPQPAPCGSAEPHEAHEWWRNYGRIPASCPGIAAPVAQQSAGAWRMTDEQFRAIRDSMRARLEMPAFSIDIRPVVEIAVHLGIVTPCIVRGSRDHDPKESAGAIPDFDGASPTKGVREKTPSAADFVLGLQQMKALGARFLAPADSGMFIDPLIAILESIPAPETKSLDADHPALSAVQADLGDGSTRPDEGAGPSESVRHAARRESRDAGLDLDAIMARANAASPGPWTINHTEKKKNIVAHHDDTGAYADVASWIPDAENDAYCTNEGECGKHRGHASTCPLHGESNACLSEWETSDMTFIAAARTDVPALVAEVQRLRAAENDRSRAMIDEKPGANAALIARLTKRGSLFLKFEGYEEEGELCLEAARALEAAGRRCEGMSEHAVKAEADVRRLKNTDLPARVLPTRE